MHKKKLTSEQTKVLQTLYGLTDAFGENCIYFRTIAKSTGLDEKAVKAAARSLREQGLAQFMRGLMTEDGRCAGAGYAITSQGVAVFAAMLRAHPRPSKETDRG